MCGIAGIFSRSNTNPDFESDICRMLAMLRHRGPDEFGYYLNDRAVLGSARLSIIDIQTGQQPISNEDQSLWIVFNGEVFNFVELRQSLQKRGHRFKTETDTEVVLHLYEDLGPKFLEQLNGQFAVAIWDEKAQTLFLARDRLGVRPLYYALFANKLFFASEIKAILAVSPIQACIDPDSLQEMFTYWSPITPRTIFRGILEVSPGHYLLATPTTIRTECYWRLNYHPDTNSSASPNSAAIRNWLEEFEYLLVDATRIRLRADVKVGAYLSGGLDSATIASVVRNFTQTSLDTFSIAFTDSAFDESQYQRRMASFLGTNHRLIEAKYDGIGQAFPDVIWHTEVPIMRTAPVPMFLLSQLVHDSGYKVVLTGEGADEFFAGYDIFKEMKVRRFWARQPNSAWRSRLLEQLYQDIFKSSEVKLPFLSAFFRQGLQDVDDPEYSHHTRWRNNQRCLRFLSDDFLNTSRVEYRQQIQSLLPSGFRDWGPLERAQFLEATYFLSPYLLSSQGDRVAMAHSVEGRFPFLDPRVVELSTRLPSELKLHVLQDKYILRQLAQKWLPPEICSRPKKPYRAPIYRSFFNGSSPDYVAELLSLECLRNTGIFKPEPVRRLVAKLEKGNSVGETDDMAIAGILSTQLLHLQFIDQFRTSTPIGPSDRVKIECRKSVTS